MRYNAWIMIDPSTGELSFNAGRIKLGRRLTLESLGSLAIAPGDAPGPNLVKFMTSKVFPSLESDGGIQFSVQLDFLNSTLTGVRLMAQAPEFPPDLTDWDLKREEARHDFHCLWVRRQLGWLWRLRRPSWGRVLALCGRNLDTTPRLSIIKVVYVEFGDIENDIDREFGGP